MANTMKELLLSRELGHRVLALLDAVASDLPPNIIVDGLMAVSASLTVAADLDEDQIASEWLRLVKELKSNRGAE
jgi:hypothetical protein